MSTPPCTRSLVGAVKRLKLSPATPAVQHQIRHIQKSSRDAASSSSQLSSADANANIRLPKAVQATYLAPLKRALSAEPTKVADLQLRSYSVRNLEVFADFAMRAAYFLKLPAAGPTPLRKITERWTVPRSNFVHKKSQENFERITLRRWIQVFDGHPDTVAVWLAFLRKHQYYGVGMKAEVYEHGTLTTGKDLEEEAEKVRKLMGEGESFASFGDLNRSGDNLAKKLWDSPFKRSWGADAAMGGTPGAGTGKERLSVPGDLRRR
ncbi:hypothetical protein DOTSEDRAFT_53963 [Dothistroma septosporum NZE10]|uniref:Small ribosomal subunit protein uS10m n=1 Tax=Dothistroma septosporum (strain NZE10 / CBS 128990) TaxID=675120 RepID=M2XKL0_DOTSN|nr:hypothetical protein DOTSEDRAFT_53963 [Dothistroma septosporum NZE10]